VTGQAAITLEHVRVAHAVEGVNLQGSSQTPAHLTLMTDVFNACARPFAAAKVDLPVVSDNRITGSTSPAYLKARTLTLGELSSNTGADNAAPGTFVSGQVVADGSWPDSSGGWPTAVGSDGLQVAGVTVRVAAGVVVKLGGDLRGWGQLSLDGSADRPAVLTDVSDDHGVGDLNGDGPSTGSFARHYVTISPASRSVGRFAAHYGLVRLVPVSVFNATSVDVAKSTFEDVPMTALEVADTPARVVNSRFLRNGMGASAAGIPVRSDDAALSVQSDDIDPADFVGNSGSGNSLDVQAIGGTVRHDSIWPAGNPGGEARSSGSPSPEGAR
jgi:hypothetical protein